MTQTLQSAGQVFLLWAENGKLLGVYGDLESAREAAAEYRKVERGGTLQILPEQVMV